MTLANPQCVFEWMADGCMHYPWLPNHHWEILYDKCSMNSSSVRDSNTTYSCGIDSVMVHLYLQTLILHEGSWPWLAVAVDASHFCLDCPTILQFCRKYTGKLQVLGCRQLRLHFECSNDVGQAAFKVRTVLIRVLLAHNKSCFQSILTRCNVYNLLHLEHAAMLQTESLQHTRWPFRPSCLYQLFTRATPSFRSLSNFSPPCIYPVPSRGPQRNLPSPEWQAVHSRFQQDTLFKKSSRVILTFPLF